MKGNTTFSKEFKEENAIIQFWNSYIGKNILKGTEILVLLSKNLECVVCPNSKKFQTKGSLSYHMRFEHYYDTVNYIRKNIIPLNQKELEDLIN